MTTDMDWGALVQMPATLARIQSELAALRAAVEHLDGTHEELHELDDRADAAELRHKEADAVLRELRATVTGLVNGVVARDALMQRVHEHMLSMLAELQAQRGAVRGNE